MRETIIRISLALAVALTAAVADGQPPPGKTGLIYPLVPGHGGVVPLPRAAEQPRKGAKAVFDITADAKPGAVNKGLEQVAPAEPVRDRPAESCGREDCRGVSRRRRQGGLE